MINLRYGVKAIELHQCPYQCHVTPRCFLPLVSVRGDDCYDCTHCENIEIRDLFEMSMRMGNE